MQIKYQYNSLLLLLFVFILSCNQGSKEKYIYHHDQGEIFTTGYDIKYAYNRSLKEEIVAELNKFDMSLNPFKENSIISKVNRNEPVKLDSFFLKVFHRAEEISRTTDGNFDITVSPLINAWGFGFQNMDSITPQIIDSLKSFVGYEKISIDATGNIIKADPRVQINTSAIAKGYACDVIANLLEGYGITNYMVAIGGEIAAKGRNNKGACWHIEVTKPVDDATGMLSYRQTVLSLCDKSIATSGNYRNYYIKDGKKYAHTIDPISGYPSQLDILGATVIADDCMTADAYATAFMVMGLKKSIETAKKLAGIHYYFIYEKNDGSFGVEYSDGFEQFFVKE
ncbi:FAD:protein FMN transferase [Proteiniphilum sp.]|uniref:FAD:protein FMN transferase n=1 Tax=Proteiniphilum sp. TaxID=1926877 RepID=UPI002B20273E|nr:FAD:protein FMN transferase [Proteiniphilum sp.]MEA4917134.1 FAD:protein FMN transferase [Proteiniphilum sp.]